MRHVAVEPISAETFAPFGDLLQAPADPPRQNGAAFIENHRAGAVPNLALVRSEPYIATQPIRRLERHPASSQTFLPLSVESYVVVVAPAGENGPDEAALRAFRVGGDAGINYRPQTWHAHMMTLGGPGIFAMLVHEDGTPEDCVFAAIAPLTLDLFGG